MKAKSCSIMKHFIDSYTDTFNPSKYLRQLVGFRYGKKTFCQNSDKFCCSFIKNDIMFMYLLYIYKKPIILSLFKIDTLNFTMYIFSKFDIPFKNIC